MPQQRQIALADAELRETLENLSDFIHIKWLKRRLHRRVNGVPVGGAALFAGAGLSFNADSFPHAAPFPSWNDLWTLFNEALEMGHDHVRRQTPPAGLAEGNRLAERIATARGRSALDEAIVRAIPDNHHEPGAVLRALVRLPWTDIFTTNWDTLLERAARHESHRNYSHVTRVEQLAYQPRPRIVKLHGSLPDATPFIFSEEDFRCYEQTHAEFVTLMRMAFIENVICMIGFSATDPNFLNWLGWVRDRLAGAALPPIQIAISAQTMDATYRLYQEKLNIRVVDLAPLVQKAQALGLENGHREALRAFIESLEDDSYPAFLWPNVLQKSFENDSDEDDQQILYFKLWNPPEDSLEFYQDFIPNFEIIKRKYKTKFKPIIDHYAQWIILPMDNWEKTKFLTKEIINQILYILHYIKYVQIRVKNINEISHTKIREIFFILNDYFYILNKMRARISPYSYHFTSIRHTILKFTTSKESQFYSDTTLLETFKEIFFKIYFWNMQSLVEKEDRILFHFLKNQDKDIDDYFRYYYISANLHLRACNIQGTLYDLERAGTFIRRLRNMRGSQVSLQQASLGIDLIWFCRFAALAFELQQIQTAKDFLDHAFALLHPTDVSWGKDVHDDNFRYRSMESWIRFARARWTAHQLEYPGDKHLNKRETEHFDFSADISPQVRPRSIFEDLSFLEQNAAYRCNAAVEFSQSKYMARAARDNENNHIGQFFQLVDQAGVIYAKDDLHDLPDMIAHLVRDDPDHALGLALRWSTTGQPEPLAKTLRQALQIAALAPSDQRTLSSAQKAHLRQDRARRVSLLLRAVPNMAAAICFAERTEQHQAARDLLFNTRLSGLLAALVACFAPSETAETKEVTLLQVLQEIAKEKEDKGAEIYFDHDPNAALAAFVDGLMVLCRHEETRFAAQIQRDSNYLLYKALCEAPHLLLADDARDALTKEAEAFNPACSDFIQAQNPSPHPRLWQAMTLPIPDSTDPKYRTRMSKSLNQWRDPLAALQKAAQGNKFDKIKDPDIQAILTSALAQTEAAVDRAHLPAAKEKYQARVDRLTSLRLPEEDRRQGNTPEGDRPPEDPPV